MTITASPLCWPADWKRTPAALKKHGKFGSRVSSGMNNWKHTEDLTITQAIQRVLQELQRMGIRRDDCVISTNLVLRLDGLPRSDQKRPHDAGAACYWEDAGARRVMAIDQYCTVEDNLAAIAATLEAMRAIERHGGAMILERAFTGFAALPAPATTQEWWQVLGVHHNAHPEDIKAAFRYLRSRYHPDKPHTGDAEKFDAVQKAYDQATAEGRA